MTDTMRVILVGQNDQEIGTEEKLRAHTEGLLHRAFSILIIDQQGKMLLQKRAVEKYHSGGLWTNACCSHPTSLLPMEQSIHQRLQEEMGFDCDLHRLFAFTYRAELDHGLIEHEYDHVFLGVYDGDPDPNPKEVDDFLWVYPKTLLSDVSKHPQCYTIWFRLILLRLQNRLAHLHNLYTPEIS